MRCCCAPLKLNHETYALADHQLVFPAGDLFPHALVCAERVAALIDVARLYGLAEAKRAGIRLLLTGNHPEQRRLSRAVRSNHADDPAARQREVEIVHEQLVAVCLPQATRLDDDVAEARAGRNVDLDLFDLLRRVFVEQLFVCVQSGLAFGLTSARRHPNPLELTLECLLTLRLGLLFLRESLLLLIEPG